MVRDRLGAGVGLLNLAASFLITLLTLAAEIGGVVLSLQLATSVNYLLFVSIILGGGLVLTTLGPGPADRDAIASPGREEPHELEHRRGSATTGQELQ